MAIYELDGRGPEFPADGLYWVAESAIVVGSYLLTRAASVLSAGAGSTGDSKKRRTFSSV